MTQRGSVVQQSRDVKKQHVTSSLGRPDFVSELARAPTCNGFFEQLKIGFRPAPEARTATVVPVGSTRMARHEILLVIVALPHRRVHLPVYGRGILLRIPRIYLLTVGRFSML